MPPYACFGEKQVCWFYHQIIIVLRKKIYWKQSQVGDEFWASQECDPISKPKAMHLNSTTSNKVPQTLQYWSPVASNLFPACSKFKSCFWFFLPSLEIPAGQRGKSTKFFLTWSSTAMLLYSATYWESIEYVRLMYQTSLSWACPKGLAFVAYKGGDIFRKLIPRGRW